MDQKVLDLQMYALIDASASPAVLQEVKTVVSVYGRRIRDGYVVTPHGEDKVIFFEIKKKECPIVEVLASLAQRHGLYPMYVIQEHKDHLPKNAYNAWFMIDEVKFELKTMTEDEFDAFRSEYRQEIKRRYKEDSVFIKSFMYLGKSGIPHVMSFNSERPVNYRGTVLGVPGWHDSMNKILNIYKPEKVFKMSVRYTNL